MGTIISPIVSLEETYHVKVIGNISAGLPEPKIPPLFLIKDMALESFLTALIAFTINFSLADLFSKKDRYKINTGQELLAAGASNIFGSFFPCFTSGASLARSCVQYNSGGKTQVIVKSILVFF
jgi:solute carrier family 26 protein